MTKTLKEKSERKVYMSRETEKMLRDMIHELYKRTHVLYMANIELIKMFRKNNILSHDERIKLLDMQLLPKGDDDGKSKSNVSR